MKIVYFDYGSSYTDIYNWGNLLKYTFKMDIFIEYNF